MKRIRCGAHDFCRTCLKLDEENLYWLENSVWCGAPSCLLRYVFISALALAVDFGEWLWKCARITTWFLFYLQDVQANAQTLPKISSYFSAVRLFASFSSPKHFPSLTSDILLLFARTHTHTFRFSVFFPSVNCRYKTKKFVYSLMVSHIFYIIHTCLPITYSRFARTHTLSYRHRDTRFVVLNRVEFSFSFIVLSIWHAYLSHLGDDIMKSCSHRGEAVVAVVVGVCSHCCCWWCTS